MIATCALLVIAVALSSVLAAVPIASNSLSLLFGGERANIVEDHREELFDRQYEDKDSVLEAAQAFVVDVAEEGFVLLKNLNASLPLAGSPKVTVFGKNSVNLVYGGTGSASNVSANSKTLYDSLEASEISYNTVIKAFYDDNAKSGPGRPANPNMDSGQRLSGFATGET
ncbi:MAG: hypothetical protein LBD16_02605, partial [Oscillospiraceae bacterium]|nr:hypothetical protein [Oscillospiraceae bacterium]